MSLQNVGVELQKAIETKETIEFFSKAIVERMDEIEERLTYFVQMGFPEDIARKYYQRYYLQDRQIIDNLSADMQSRHVDFFERVIDDLKASVDQE